MRTREGFAEEGENVIESSTSVLIVVLFFEDRLTGVLGVGSLFRLRPDGITSSMSAGSVGGSFVARELERELRVLRRVALRNVVVSCEILEVRMVDSELCCFGAAVVEEWKS